MTTKTTIYIFGNELLDFDNLPIKLAPELQKEFPDINFIIQDPNENTKPSETGKLIIIDTVINTDEVIVINDIEKIETSPIYSMHDFDLAFNLKLLKKIGQLKKLTILGVPPDINKKTALEQLIYLLNKL